MAGIFRNVTIKTRRFPRRARVFSAAGRGFTIIEMLVAIAVFTLMFGAIMSSIAAIYRTQGYTMQQSLAIGEARRGIDIMAKEVREARYGDNGAYPIEKGAGKEFIFYGDVDNDGRAERVRYYLAMVNSETLAGQCWSGSQGGACSVNFSNFLTGTLKSATVRVSTEGYYGTTGRYSEFYIDGVKFGNICQGSCAQCAAAWQGTQTYDVGAAAADDSLQFQLDGTSNVKADCQWVNPNHSIKAMFEFSFTEEIPNAGNEFRRGVTEPSGSPATYPADQEKSAIITSYVRNAPPIFTYYDKNGSQLTDDPAILRDTKIVKLHMIVDVNPERTPYSYDLEQWVQIRNLKEE